MRGRQPQNRRDFHRSAPLPAPPAKHLARVTKPRASLGAATIALRVAIQMDPIENINISGDSPCNRHERRRAAISSTITSPTPSPTRTAAFTQARTKPARPARGRGPFPPRQVHDPRSRSRCRRCADAPGSPVRPRLYHATHLLERSRHETLVVNDPEAVHNAPERSGARLRAPYRRRP
jgi:glutathione synthase